MGAFNGTRLRPLHERQTEARRRARRGRRFDRMEDAGHRVTQRTSMIERAQSWFLALRVPLRRKLS